VRARQRIIVSDSGVKTWTSCGGTGETSVTFAFSCCKTRFSVRLAAFVAVKIHTVFSPLSGYLRVGETYWLHLPDDAELAGCYIAAGPRQHSDSWFWVPRDSWPCFTVWRIWEHSELRLWDPGLCSSEMLISNYQITRCHNREDHTFIYFLRSEEFTGLLYTYLSRLATTKARRRTEESVPLSKGSEKRLSQCVLSASHFPNVSALVVCGNRCLCRAPRSNICT
jgi:hypothetical protein